MFYAYAILLVAAVFAIFLCGYYVAVIKQKFGKNWLAAAPIAVAILLFNVIWVIVELGKQGRW